MSSLALCLAWQEGLAKLLDNDFEIFLQDSARMFGPAYVERMQSMPFFSYPFFSAQ